MNYTWSRAMDEIDTMTVLPSDTRFDRRRDFAVAGFDRTHILTIDYVYEMPKFANGNALTKAVA